MKDIKMSTINSYSIMFIDDEPNIIKLYSMLLEKNGYSVYGFDNAPDALKFMENGEHKIDLIISDLNMPEMTGLQFLDHIKKNKRHSSVPLIFLSAVSDSKIHVDAFDSGAVDFLTKPVQKEIFLSKIKALLKSYALKTAQERIYLTGSRQDKEVDDIIAVCEAEGITGFTVFYSDGKIAVLYFKGGMLEEIEYDGLTGVEALEIISGWTTYTFSIFQGRYDENIVKQFILSEEINSNAESGTNSAENTVEVLEEGMLEIVSLPENSEIEDLKQKALNFYPLYVLNSDFTNSISRLINQKPKSAELEFTDNKVLSIINSEDKNKAVMFKDKKAWQRYQEKNDLR